MKRLKDLEFETIDLSFNFTIFSNKKLIKRFQHYKSTNKNPTQLKNQEMSKQRGAPRAMRGGDGTANPNLDAPAMSTTLDRSDINYLVEQPLERF